MFYACWLFVVNAIENPKVLQVFLIETLMVCTEVFSTASFIHTSEDIDYRAVLFLR